MLTWNVRVLSLALVAALAACSDGVTGPLAQEAAPMQAAFSDDSGIDAASLTSQEASVVTDKDDYQPGDTVTITGTGWEPGETVHLHISEEPQNHPDHNFYVEADADGAFTHRDLVMDEDHLGVTFSLTATGESSGKVAEWTFTDGIPKEDGLAIVVGQDPNPVEPGSTATYSVELDFVGNSGACTVELTLTPSPSPVWPGGHSHSFSPSSLTGSGGDTKTSDLTIDFPSDASDGTYAFTVGVSYPSGHGCQNTNQFPTASGTLVVASPTPSNTPPTADAGGPYSGDEGSAIDLDGATASDDDEDPLTYAWSYTKLTGHADAACTFSDATTLNPTITCNDNGTFEVTLEVDDGEAPPVSSTADLTVNNVNPTATFTAPEEEDEGATFQISLTDPSDPSSVDVSVGLTYAFDCGDGDGYGTPGSSSTATCDAVDGPATLTVKGKVIDKDGGESEHTAEVDVNNVAPSVGAITGAPAEPIQVGTEVSICASFTDPGTLDTHTGTIDWNANGWEGGPDASSTAVIDDTVDPNTACGSHTYTSAGVFALEVTVTDGDDSGASPLYEYVVVYDPSAGFVTGGGWIHSPEGAYRPDDGSIDPTGRANFGFVSRYKKGANRPDGNTEFQFKAGNLNFHSSDYEWLVVNQGGERAQFKGTGTVNGQSGYEFMLWAQDRDDANGGDTFRIRITDEYGDVIYDNHNLGSVEDYGSTTLGGGSIVIHTGGNGNGPGKK